MDPARALAEQREARYAELRKHLEDCKRGEHVWVDSEFAPPGTPWYCTYCLKFYRSPEAVPHAPERGRVEVGPDATEERRGDPLQALQAALRGADALRIELLDGTTPGQRRSYAYYGGISNEDAEAVGLLVKKLARLDISGPPRVQSGSFYLEIENAIFTVTRCPQHDGEILAIRRRYPALPPGR